MSPQRPRFQAIHRTLARRDVAPCAAVASGITGTTITTTTGTTGQVRVLVRG